MRMSTTVRRAAYAVAFDVEYPERKLDRLTAFVPRRSWRSPILIVLGLVCGATYQSNYDDTAYASARRLARRAHGA